MILMLDNYDSFTYNLVQYLGELRQKVKVVRNDCITVDEIRKHKVRSIVISPGPCTPKEAGISCEVIRAFAGSIPILGVCLGHQCIGQAFGAKIVRARTIMHGKTSQIFHKGRSILKGLSNPFTATRYHSLVIDEKTLPKTFWITARSEDGTIMAIEHKKYPLFGVQFHPESILTTQGKRLLRNFIRI